jgi:hypothetical protein
LGADVPKRLDDARMEERYGSREEIKEEEKKRSLKERIG